MTAARTQVMEGSPSMASCHDRPLSLEA